jgi:hypothetical protein
MSKRKTVIKDPLYRHIVDRLNDVDAELFEQCMGDLLRNEFPGLVPVRGGSDSGWDGEIPDTDGELFPLICTTGADVLRNLTKSLVAIDREGRFPKRKVALATSQALTPKRRQALRQRAEEKGFKLQQIVEQQALANLLYRNSHWTKELLGLSGAPSALSVVPDTRRPLLELEPVGRDEELKWLRMIQRDSVLSGDPGSGKTFLFYHLIRHLRWDALFLASSDPRSIANAIRDQQPAIVVVDDAHENPDRLASLVRLRREIHADFRIVAATWEGGKDSVVEALSCTSEPQVRRLELLTRDEIWKVIQQVGVEASSEILRDLVDQAANKPGLAVTIATLWLQGLWQQVLDGSFLSRNFLGTFNSLVGEKATVVLGAFSLGGDRGMGMEEVREWIEVDRAEFHRLTSGLAAGGVLAQADTGVLAVWPRQLRWALLRSVFFPEDRPGLPYRQLFDRAPNRESAAEALVAARHRKAAIPDRELRGLLQECGARRAWEAAAALSPDFAEWTLATYPGDLCDIAGAALRANPEATIERLLERAVGEARTTNSWDRHPMRLLSDWVREPIRSQVLFRRRLLAREAKRFLDAGGESEVGARGLCTALTPCLEGHSRDPGIGLSLTISFGRVPAECLPEIIALWDEARGGLREISSGEWPHFKNLIWEWMHPEMSCHSPDMPAAEKEIMRVFAEKVLRDLVPLARRSIGISSGLKALAGRHGVDLTLELDPTFEVLYPQEAPKLEERSAWDEARRAAAQSLGLEWARQNPTAVVTKLRDYEAEAQRIGRRWPRMAPLVCEEIAETVADPEQWAAEFLDGQAPADSLRPFLARSTKLWESLVGRCLGLPEYRWLATELILEAEAPSEDLLTAALAQAEELPQIVETLCLQRRVPISSLRKLLHHPHWETALAAAVGEWCASPREEVREELHTDWRDAIFRAQTDDHTAVPQVQSLQYWLGIILAGDRELAIEWVLRQLATDRPLQVMEDEVFGQAVAVLDRSQRFRVLKALDGDVVPYHFLALLIGRDDEIYRALLESEPLRPYHLEPLHLEPLEQVPDEAWMELALLAAEAGYDVEPIVEAAFGTMLPFYGSGAQHWSRWMQAFIALEGDPRPDAKRIACRGRRMAEERVSAALAEERHRAVAGF